MKLLVVETSAHGGMLHYAVQLGNALAARGHAVDLLTPRGNELADREHGARMRAVLTPPVSSWRSPPAGVRYLLRRAGVAFRLALAWGRVVWEARRRYDAVVLGDIELSLSAAAALVITALPRRPRLIHICHNVRGLSRQTGVGETRTVVGFLLQRLYGRFDLTFVHGERSRAEYEAIWPPTRLAIIPHGDERVFADEPPPPATEERILFFGDWRAVKGLFVLMRAFDELVARRSGVRLTIAGAPHPADGDPDAVRAWAARHGDRVRVIDSYVPLEQVAGVFAEARAVVTPYLAGYQSGVIHVAMTMARAVVTTDVGDLGTVVVDGETGRIVPPRDHHALAAALEQVVIDASLAQRMGAAGRRRMLESASWELVAERFEAEAVKLFEAESPAPR